MRTEREMMDLLLGLARKDERIRAAYMNGSRVNPNAAKDRFRDYDIVYVVTETTSFIEDKAWPLQFGELLILQEPDANDLGWGLGHDATRRYAWLMLFTDGTRVDASIEIKEETDLSCDTLTLVLLDKDGILPAIPPANDSGYWLKPPGKEKYRGCCNEFWWCLNNVAKAIARDQLPYAMRMYSQIVHAELEKMTEWYIGMHHAYAVTTGMWGKYFKKYLPPALYTQYQKTYSDGDYENLWAAVFTACDLFHALALPVARHFGFSYRQDEEAGMRKYLAMVKQSI